MILQVHHAVFFSRVEAKKKYPNVYRINSLTVGAQCFYAFGTGPYAFVILIASNLKPPQRTKINPSRSFGRLNAHVGTKTAEGSIPSIQEECQILQG
jgi:hypothetical protein